MVVGDIGAVPNEPWGAWDAAGDAYGGGARGERDGGVVDRDPHPEHHDSSEPGGDGVDERDGAGNELRSDDVHGGYPNQGHGVRVYGVVVGVVGALPDGGRWVAGDAAGDAHGGGACGHCDGGFFDRSASDEQCALKEFGRHWVGKRHCLRQELWYSVGFDWRSVGRVYL